MALDLLKHKTLGSKTARGSTVVHDSTDASGGNEAIIFVSAQHIDALAFGATNSSSVERDPQPIECEPQSQESFDWSVVFAYLPPDIQVWRLKHYPPIRL
jgi:hypothetical protein